MSRRPPPGATVGRLRPGALGRGSPVATALVLVLGWPLILLGLVWAYGAYRAVDPVAPPPAPTGRVQHPSFHGAAEAALARFRALPAPERAALRARLETALVDPERWAAGLAARGYAVLCLGEDHEDATRTFVARRLLPALAPDALLLETTPADLRRLRGRIRAGEPRAGILGADAAGLLAAAGPARLAGIEETPVQREARRAAARGGARDDSIAENFWRAHRRGERQVVLFGALHCTRDRSWLFGRIAAAPPARLGGPALSARVLGEHQEGPVEAFTWFLDEIGFPRRDLVLADPEGLDERVAAWFALLLQQARRYDALVVFREPDGAATGG